MKKLRIGVVGVGRGASMMKYCKLADNAELVAVCDNWVDGLRAKEKEMSDSGVTFYESYDEFLNHDMDAVVLANYATEHVPFALKAFDKGLDVFSEVLPCHNMKQAVELVEAIERTGRKYCYLENTCYMPGPMEMKKLYRAGELGEFEYGEGEYCHNCESIWPKITHGDPAHWRNNMFVTFYCTHSLGPLIHITGLRPVSVTGLEMPNNERMRNMGRTQGVAGLEMVTLENGAILKSLHGELYCHSIWFSIYGSKGRMETAREDAEMGHSARFYKNVYKVAGDYTNADNHVEVNYLPKDNFSTLAKKFSHMGCDFYCMWNAVEYMLGNPNADPINVYEALDMYLPGLFAYFSILDGGKPQKLPDLRNPEERDAWRNDTRCTDPKVAGDQLLPCYSKPVDPIPDEVFKKVQADWEKIAPPKSK